MLRRGLVLRSKLFGVAPAVLYAAFVFTFGSLTVSPSMLNHSNDKLWHALGFGLAQLLNHRALKCLWPAWPCYSTVAVAWLATTTTGGLLELWQSLLVHRSSEWGDALANGLGALVVAVVQGLRSGRRERAVEG